MTMCDLRIPICVIFMSLMLLASSVRTETIVEVSFTTNPVLNGTQTGFDCRIWDLGPNQQVGLARLDKDNQNVVLVRDSVLLAQVPDNIFLTVIPAELDTQADGSALYHLTIMGTTEEDAGTYSCYVLTVTDTVMAVATDSAVLEVSSLPPDGYPMCSTSINRLSFYAGDNITLTCLSLDGKPSISLLWIDNNGQAIPENQVADQEDGILHRNVTITLAEEDHGTVFKCMIVSLEFPSNGRECEIGPVAVWPPPDPTMAVTDLPTVSNMYVNTTVGNVTTEFSPRLIFGLTLTVFVMIVVGGSILLLVTIILLFVFCMHNYSCTCLVRRRKYSMQQGLIDKKDTLESGTGTHTLRQTSLVESQFTPVRPAPVSPPSYDSAVQKRNYTPNASAQNNASKRLSAVEQALLLAMSKSMSPSQPSQSIQEEEGEIIYANTSRPASRSSSMIELHKIVNEEVQDEGDNMNSDSDSGVVNPAYDNNETSFAEEQNPPAASRSRSASQSEVIYHNTSSAFPQTQEAETLPTYAKVDKSRSRSSTMESLKARKVVEPEAVTTLDDSVIYGNTAVLGVLGTDSSVFTSTPPPIPATPPSPIRKELSKEDYRKRASSLGGPAKPSFKPPPPPSPGPLTRPKSEAVIYGNTLFDDENEEPKAVTKTTRPKPKVPPKPKPVPPKKPTYNI